MQGYRFQHVEETVLGAVSLAWGFRARRRALALGGVTLALGLRSSLRLRLPVLGGFPAAMSRPTPPWRAVTLALGVRDAKNRLFWSLAVKTDGFSRSRKWEVDVFAGCSRLGFPIAQIIVRFGLEAAKNRQF